jgi:hypothetical protein
MKSVGVARFGCAAVLLVFFLALEPGSAADQNPWERLSGFDSVGISQVSRSAVVAILFNSAERLIAIVAFPAVCNGAECDLSDPGAFLITDLEGQVQSIHVEAGREDFCQRTFAALLDGFAPA